MSKQDAISPKSETENLKLEYVFGMRTDLQNSVQFFAQDKFAYIAGYYVVIYSFSKPGQFFFPAYSDYREITSFSVDESNDIIVLFLSQKVNDRIYFIFRYINKTFLKEETGRNKNLYFQENKLQVIASSLNLTSGYCCALIGPDAPSMVIIYSLENKYNPKLFTKIILQASFPYINILINRHDSEKISLWGNGGYAILLKLKDGKHMEITQNTFQDFSKVSFEIVSCVWVSETRVAFLNSNCDVMIIDFVERYQGDSLTHRKLIKSKEIFEVPGNGISIFEKNYNLFVAKNDGFIMKLDLKNKEEMIYEKSPSSLKQVTNLPEMEIACLSSIKNIDSSSPNYSILISTTNGQLYQLDLSNDNAICDGANYKFPICEFHSDSITSIDVAKWKQLVATCSKDKTVRVWNYVHYHLEAWATYEDEPLKVAFHPTGLNLAILFKGSIKLVDILENTLKEYREFRIYQPSDIKFSNFGTMLLVCFKSFFRIYNFYTGVKICESKDLVHEHKELVGHTIELTTATWDKDDDGVSTVGKDGKIIYWDLRKYVQPIIYQTQSLKLKKTEIMTLEDQINKKIFVLDENQLFELYNQKINKEDENSNKIDDNKTYELRMNVVEEGDFSDLVFDQESKILLLSYPNDQTCGLKMLDYGKYLNQGLRDFLSFQANAFGIKAIKASSDMNHVFTGGNDRCLFFFSLGGVAKNTEKNTNDIQDADNLILISKEYLDQNAKALREVLNKKDLEIQREEEEFKLDSEKNKNEIEEQEKILENTIEEFENQKTELKKKKKTQIEINEEQLEKNRAEHSSKMDKLNSEHEINIKAKMEDLRIEEEKLKELIKRNNNNIRKLTDDILQDKKKTEDEHKKIIEDLSSKIKNLENKQTEILKNIEEDKKDKMDTNDRDINEKRRELDKLKKHYEFTKAEHKTQEDKLKKEIDEIRSANKKTENKRTKQKTELETLQMENNKLEKQIRDMHTDRNEKEETLKDKNDLKRKLDKDNQELEKFKYVLHYKIKELKHNKEPKERKIQQMEKKAKDMEREIKSCELGQASIIIELSTNHQVIKIHEEQIAKTEKRIEELRRYKKLFQENLYNSMKRAKNHKDCKREYVLLKRNFLDKETIKNVEKPFELNHESQREFLEKNVDHYKGKINTMNKIFVNDHSKVMKEKRQLISIENQLEKEKREIQEADTYKSDKVSGITRQKGKLKAEVPRFPHPKKKKGEEADEEEEDERRLKDLADELKAVVKEVQWYKYWGKKKELENMNKEKNDSKERGMDGDEDYNNYE